jgi:hypothetical protein
MLLATLQACGGASASGGLEAADALDGAAPSAEGSTSDAESVVVVGDGGTGHTGIDAAVADAAAADATDSSVPTSADAAPDEGADASVAAADASLPDADPVPEAASPVPDAAPVSDAAAVPDATPVEAGPVCTTTQLLCGGACVAIDSNNCGACGHACTGLTPVCGTTGGTYGCTSGCAAGQTRCGNLCVDTATDGDNCGACSQACGDGETCQASHCACPAGETLCGSACTPTATDDANCGSCGHACGGGQTCQSGSCVCPAGQAFCGGTCTDESTDGANCGVCGHACSGGETCQSGTCACPSGQSFCGSACTSESTDEANCGACGHACVGGETCESGTCECPSGQAFCGSACTNESSDGNNCGGCGHVCTGGETCQSGACACPAGETLCGTTCVAEATDANNCGACGHGCLGGACSGGSCQPVVLATPGAIVNAVATDGTYVYWTSDSTVAAPQGSVAKCEIASCATTTTQLATGTSQEIWSLAVDATEGRVLFGDQTGLWATTTSGGTRTAWGPSSGPTFAIWVALPVYYWSGEDQVGLYLSNGAGTYVGSAIAGLGGCVEGIATDASHVYATDWCNGRLLSCPLNTLCGSTPNVVATAIPDASELFYDGTALWMTSQGTGADNFADGAIYKCSATSCSVFASAQAGASNVVSDGTDVYWTNWEGGTVMRSPTGGAQPTKIASDSYPLGIAQTSTAILWGDEEGKVTLLAK